MPTYEYACRACGHEFEEIQKMSDPPIEVCPKCGDKAVQRLISQGNFILKGGGWYTTGGYGAPAKSTESSSSKSESKSNEAKTDSKTESKPETKTETKSDDKAQSKTEKKETKPDKKDRSSSGRSGGSSSEAA